MEDIDGAVGGSSGSAEIVPVQDAEKMTGNMNLIKLKKALDEMSKVYWFKIKKFSKVICFHFFILKKKWLQGSFLVLDHTYQFCGLFGGFR